MTVAAPPIASAERKPLTVLFRLLERDERVFAVLLAVVMVGGLAALGLFPLRPRYRVDLYSAGVLVRGLQGRIFALVTVNPRATRPDFLGALAVDLCLVFVLLCLTGGVESVFYLLFFPSGRRERLLLRPLVGLGAALAAGGSTALAAALVPPWVGWTPVYPRRCSRACPRSPWVWSPSASAGRGARWSG